MRTKRWLRAGVPILLLALAAPAPVIGQSEVEPGFNLFSVEQDVEIGRRSAETVERDLPVLRDRTVEQFVDRVGQRLAARAPHADYPYQFKVLDLADINAFALPGGYMYINRGLIEAVNDEAELAGVMAHEIAHVALRHGTNQASKAYLANAGLAVLGGIFGDRSTTEEIVTAVGGFGLNALFLEFSRDDEEEADIVGAQILAGSGYEPMAMVDMFATLRSHQQRRPNAVERFFSSHPTYAEREEIIRQEAQLIGRVEPRPHIGGLPRVQDRLAAMPAAPTMERYVAGDTRRPEEPTRRRPTDVRIEPPSSRLATYRQPGGYFEIAHPENWRVYESRNGFGATFVPDGGVVTSSSGREEILYGVVINHYEPFDRSPRGLGFASPEGLGHRRTTLEAATDDLVRTLQASNQHLRVLPNSQHSQTIDNRRALSLVLYGQSPVTGEEERVTLFTRETSGDDHLIYALMIAPTRGYDEMRSTFDRMIRSLQVDDAAVHR